MRQKSDIGAFHTGASIEVETGLIVFGTEDPWSLQLCQKQSQTSPLNSGGGFP